MSAHRLALIAGVTAALAMVPAAASAASAQGRFTTIHVPGAADTGAIDINDPGMVVGSYFDHNSSVEHGFLGKGGAFTTLDVPGAIATVPSGVNDRKVVAGSYKDSHQVFHGFTDRGGHLYAAINDPHAGSAKRQGTQAQYLNNHGVLAGDYIDAHGVFHGFLNKKGRFTTINHPHAGTSKGQGTIVFYVNDHGVLTGQYITNRGQTVSFTGRPGAFTSGGARRGPEASAARRLTAPRRSRPF